MPISTELKPLHRGVLTRRRLNLLVWHDVVPPEKKIVWFDTTSAEFAAQLQILKKAGANPISLADARAYLSSGTPDIPPRSVVLCFDDNTSGIRENALPALAKYNWPCLVSAHTAYVGVRTGKPHNSWAELREMRRSGRVEIAAQTHTHPADLTKLSDTAVTEEMNRCRSAMRENLGEAIAAITYPAGKWDDRVARIASGCGFTIGLTEDHGAAESSPYLLAIHRWSTHKRFDEAVRAIRKSR